MLDDLEFKLWDLIWEFEHLKSEAKDEGKGSSHG